MMNGDRRNTQYTFRYNTSLGRHGWLRLTPAYSVRMVEKILSELDYTPESVLEPFSGTGTTELVCAEAGILSFAYDVNPFLVWLAHAKNAVYSSETIRSFQNAARKITGGLSHFTPYEYPPIYNIKRWWHSKQLHYLARLKTAIWTVTDQPVLDLLKIAFCRQIIALSNAAFNHVSTSFQDGQDSLSFTDEGGNLLFLSSCDMIQSTAAMQPKKPARIELHDSMYIPPALSGGYDTIITSPPYPNRISYIRELRPYMYWLEYIQTAEDASELDWKTIGGTWGAATSRLATWEQKTNLLPDYLFEIADRIEHTETKSAKLMANYVLKYFDDMAAHIQSAFHTIKDAGTVHYIVGNSNFYGNTVPTDDIYKFILEKVGFHKAKSEIVRKRNCNKALYEYWISARKM